MSAVPRALFATCLTPAARRTGSATSRSRAITFSRPRRRSCLLGAIVWKVVDLAWPAISKYGLGFLTGTVWDPVKGVFGALPFIYGTAVTSLLALLIATPLAIAIALYLSELAPRGVRGIVGSLVEMLAAIPSVVLGLWGILVLGPFLAEHVEPWLHDNLGFIPLFSGAPHGGRARSLHRLANSHDHDRPDHREHLPRALPPACRASSRRGRSLSARHAGRWFAASSCLLRARGSPPRSSSGSGARSARRSP